MALKPKIQALIDYANETTEAGDVTLGDAVKTLADGYNGGANVPSAPLVIPSGEMSAKLAALLAYSNEVTGAGDTRMGDAIKTLCEGYGHEDELILYDWCKPTQATIKTGLFASKTLKIEVIARREADSSGYTFAFGYRSGSASASTTAWVIGGTTSGFIRMHSNVSFTIPVGAKVLAGADIQNGHLYATNLDTGASLQNYNYSPGAPSGAALTNELTYLLLSGTSRQYASATTYQYGCKIWDNGVLIRDYKPCTFNGKAGMWDAAREVFCPLYEGSLELGNDGE